LSLGLRLGAFIVGICKDLFPGERVDGSRLVHLIMRIAGDSRWGWTCAAGWGRVGPRGYLYGTGPYCTSQILWYLFQDAVEALNHALEGIPEDWVRVHVCGGGRNGPHTNDPSLQDALPLMLQMHAGGYAIEAANPRHEHEWEVWKQVKRPEGKMLYPGFIGQKTNLVGHPELVANRLVRYANPVGRENVMAGTDCGLGGRPHPEIVWAKFQAMAEGARLASKQLWS
jgi:hypothetical protein